jgi:hypothetical protein
VSCINSGNGRRCASLLTLDRNKCLRKPTCYGTRSMAARLGSVFAVGLANPSLHPTYASPLRGLARAGELQRYAS